MANTLANFDVLFYARAALMSLKNRKGIVRMVSRQAETERQSSWEQGSVINLREATLLGPATEHVAGTGTTAEDVKGQNTPITLNRHFEKKITLTDREIAYGSEKLLNEHIPLMVDRVADIIEGDIYGLGHYVGPHALATGSTAVDIILAARKVLLENKCPMDGNIVNACDPSLEAKYLADAIFHAAEKTGQGGNLGALEDGFLGKKFGVNFFVSQLAQRLVAQQTATLAATAGGGDRAGVVKAATDVNATSLLLDDLTNDETIAPNADRFTIAGDPTVYRVTAVSGAVTSTEVTVTIFPGLRKPAGTGAVVTFIKRETIEDAAAGVRENLMFHRNAFALAMAPLPTTGDGMGAKIASVVDEQSGLSLRLRAWYEGGASKVNLAVDGLWGVQVLNPMLAVRMLRAQ